MVTTQRLSSLIIDGIKKAQNQSILLEGIYNNSSSEIGKNEFLFFIKPEILIKSDKIQLDKILELIETKIEAFGFNIHNIKILSASYLDQYNIIAQHYGVINKISSNAVANLSELARVNFKKIYGKDISELKVLGGSEFLNHYPDFNANSLDFLWQNKKCAKLAGGTYSLEIKLDDERIYLINGFHPRQLLQYIAKGRSIVIMTLSSNISWKVARTNFIGDTFPENAVDGSIRKELLSHKNELGLLEVSQAYNGVHLSAGPVEALIELCRYNSDYTNKNEVKHFSDFSFGEKLKRTFNNDTIQKILSNINLFVEGKEISVFDLTEEKDSDIAIELLSKYF